MYDMSLFQRLALAFILSTLAVFISFWAMQG